ncbi:hypothetical protein QBC35DRAFT_480818 [Podospora australis]|uniref:Heparan-alpha-glucosaminide N-acetyltransferase catalytic domain-containing protein n=1 Tax=Podospora australis TaxID=1536484 RepID=A0AAN6X8B4_9PEZI|nr:hypothetical protein QBC35DRAFT_480818 [Podospora australis]
MKHSSHEEVTIPPQPDPAVQETSFESDADPSSYLEEIPHTPIPDDDERQQRHRPNHYGSVSPTALPKPGPRSPARAIAPDILRGLLMALMALDHTAMMLNAWPHGTAVDGENDSRDVHRWNRTAAYVIRTLTHLCAPGFTFLLGMGVVYFSRSRTNLSWTSRQMGWHFFVRAVVLTAVSELLGLVISVGRVWFFNIVLFALAVDYFLAGVLWLALARTEKALAFALLKALPLRRKDKDDPTEALLQPRDGIAEDIAPDRTIIRAADISWHAHNVFLAILSAVTIWWNIWLSPTGGHCGVEPVAKLPDSIFATIWFYNIFTDRVLSGFPPLAWLSFAVLGLLYGRIILARSWTARSIRLGNALAGLVFLLIFVFSRLFHFGNLSEGCLHMAEHAGQGNQYLASARSFFYLTKYPPDVAFWAFTMAANHLLLAFFAAIPVKFAERTFHVFLVYGTSALFFYILHMFVLLALGRVMVALVGHHVEFPNPFTGKDGMGVDQLWAFFATWAMCLAILYPLCRWYGTFKRGKGPDSIWRFF